MTAICGVVEGNTVYIGGDSCASGESMESWIRNDKKVFRNGPFLIGFAGSWRGGQLLQYKFYPPPQEIYMTAMTYMVTDFVDSLRECLEENKFNHEKDILNFLVGYKGNLYTIEADLNVGLVCGNFSAVGSGASIALGSLYTTSKFIIPARKRIKLALEAASTFNGGVAPPFFIKSLKLKTG